MWNSFYDAVYRSTQTTSINSGEIEFLFSVLKPDDFFDKSEKVQLPENWSNIGSGSETGEYNRYAIWEGNPNSINEAKDQLVNFFQEMKNTGVIDKFMLKKQTVSMKEHTRTVILPNTPLEETSLFIPIERLITIEPKDEEYKLHVANSFSVYQAREELYGETLPELFEKHFFNDYELPMRVSTGGRRIGDQDKTWFDIRFYTSLIKTKKRINFSKLVDTLKTRYIQDADELKKKIAHYQKRCKKLWNGSFWQGKVPSSLQMYNKKHTETPIYDNKLWKSHRLYKKYEKKRRIYHFALVVTNRDLDALMKVALDLNMVDCICTNYMEYY